MMPQFLDLKHIRKGDHYYKPMLEELAGDLTVVDIAPVLLSRADQDSLFIHDRYGGHFSAAGNQVVAEELSDICRGLLEASSDWVPGPQVVGNR